MDKAKEWGLNVKAIPGNYNYYGYFSNDKKEIAMATEEESVFFHELAHAAHARIKNRDGNQQSKTWEKEIVAELTAATLCRIVGKTSKHLGNSYRYIRHYSERAGLTPIKGILSVLATVEQVLSHILQSQSPKPPYRNILLSFVKRKTPSRNFFTFFMLVLERVRNQTF